MIMHIRILILAAFIFIVIHLYEISALDARITALEQAAEVESADSRSTL